VNKNNNENENNNVDNEQIIEIMIEMEIKSISDLLNLTETHKLDAKYKYNINMKALHDIKDPLMELNNMIGMKELKNNIVDQILYFIQGLHKNDDLTGEYLHTVIYGPPGTGKTEIAKIMGKIYSKINILSKGTFKKVTRSDLIAGYLGQTALKTREVIKESLGGVLFIDEAYSLGNSEKKDSFSKECIDTLCEAMSDHRDDLMVIIAGYENELNETFFRINPGMQSRFMWKFVIDKYEPKQLMDIFAKKVRENEWLFSDEYLEEPEKQRILWFRKNKEHFPNYGRDMELLFSYVKICHAQRIFGKNPEIRKKLSKEDLEKGLELFIENKASNTKGLREIPMGMYL
jgi:SpoVK/Ycf46/Vps4 family AAA+-type ATPase